MEEKKSELARKIEKEQETRMRGKKSKRYNEDYKSERL